MKLIHLIQPKRVFLNLKATNLEEAIRMLVPKVQPGCTADGKNCLTEEVLERERLVSTIVGHGFALPHARSEQVSELTIGLGIFPEGLSDPTPDDLPVKIVFLLLEPKRVSKLYLKTLGVLARLASIPDIVDKLSAAKTAAEVVTMIEATNLIVTERLCAGDISRRVEPARVGMTLKRVADLFFKNDILTLPVLDELERVVGVVSCADLLQTAMPEYAKMIGDLSFLSDFEPFDRFLHEEDKMQVESVMEEKFVTVDETASIIEVTSLLLSKNQNALVVSKDGRYQGMISVRDIITKVMRT